MALSAEQLAFVELFRKASEDKVVAQVAEMFLVKYGTKSAVVGNNVISFATDTDNGAEDTTKDDPYDDTDYVINIHEALDDDSIDVKGELEITSITVGGFTIVYTPFAGSTGCEIKWQTSRKVPKISFWD